MAASDYTISPCKFYGNVKIKAKHPAMRLECCPHPQFRKAAPLSIGSRVMRRQVVPRYGGLDGECSDRRLVYSRFCLHQTICCSDEDRHMYTCCAFTADDTSLVLGNSAGDLTVYSLLAGDEELLLHGFCGFPILRVEPAKDCKRLLLMTAEGGEQKTSCQLFSLETRTVMLTYRDSNYVEFSKAVQNKVVGTKDSAATIYDAESGKQIQKLKRSNMSSHYTNNRATFSYDDKLVLSDGLLWDVRARSAKHIHKFDKLNNHTSGVFHPHGLEVIINKEVWDLRNYRLLHTVPSFNQRSLRFNSDGTIIYAAYVVSTMADIYESTLETALTTFTSVDAQSYVPVGVKKRKVKHNIFDFAVDGQNCFVTAIEQRRRNQIREMWDGPSISVCRLYEVGREKGEDEEEDESDDDSDFSERGSGSSYDTPSFAVSLSSDSSPTRTGRKRRRRRRHLRGGGYDISDSDFDDEDVAWATSGESSSEDGF